jgi:hypothetical protein
MVPQLGLTKQQISTKLARNVHWMVLYQICVFGADLNSNMAARVHNVFSLAEILKIFLSETTKSIGPPSEHFWQVWLKSVQRFQRRRFKCEKLTDGRRTLTHDKSSHGLWPGELKISQSETGRSSIKSARFVLIH